MKRTLLHGMPAVDQIRVMRAAFVLLPLRESTINLWCEGFDYLIQTIDGKRPAKRAKRGKEKAK